MLNLEPFVLTAYALKVMFYSLVLKYPIYFCHIHVVKIAAKCAKIDKVGSFVAGF